MGSMQGDDLQLQGDLACENAEIRTQLKVAGQVISGGGGGGASGGYGLRFAGDAAFNTPTEFYNSFQTNFGNLTISSGGVLSFQRSASMGGGTGNTGFIYRIDGTLTITGTGRIDHSGGDAVAEVNGDHGSNNGNGQDGLPGLQNGSGADGRQYQLSWFLTQKSGGAGGNGSAGVGGVAGFANADFLDGNLPMSADMFGGAPAFLGLNGITGGVGGAGGNGNNVDYGGGGGGQGGIIYLFARHIVAPAGSIRARGGNGAAGTANNCGGGGGGMGGVIIVFTEDTIDPAIFDVSGGAGGASGGGVGTAGTAGDAGRVCIVTPSGATWIG